MMMFGAFHNLAVRKSFDDKFVACAFYKLVLELQDQRKGEVRWRPSMQGSQKTIDTILNLCMKTLFEAPRNCWKCIRTSF